MKESMMDVAKQKEALELCDKLYKVNDGKKRVYGGEKKKRRPSGATIRNKK